MGTTNITDRIQKWIFTNKEWLILIAGIICFGLIAGNDFVNDVWSGWNKGRNDCDNSNSTQNIFGFIVPLFFILLLKYFSSINISNFLFMVKSTLVPPIPYEKILKIFLNNPSTFRCSNCKILNALPNTSLLLLLLGLKSVSSFIW